MKKTTIEIYSDDMPNYVGYVGEDALKIMWLCTNCHIQQYYIYGFKIGLKEYDAEIVRQNKVCD